MIPKSIDPQGLRDDRARFSRWEHKVDRLVGHLTQQAQPQALVQALESLWHRKESVGIKIERLAVSRARGELTLRRDLERAWRDLEEAWEVTLRLRDRLAASEEAAPTGAQRAEGVPS